MKCHSRCPHPAAVHEGLYYVVLNIGKQMPGCNGPEDSPCSPFPRVFPKHRFTVVSQGICQIDLVNMASASGTWQHMWGSSVCQHGVVEGRAHACMTALKLTTSRRRCICVISSKSCKDVGQLQADIRQL